MRAGAKESIMETSSGPEKEAVEVARRDWRYVLYASTPASKASSGEVSFCLHFSGLGVECGLEIGIGAG